MNAPSEYTFSNAAQDLTPIQSHAPEIQRIRLLVEGDIRLHKKLLKTRRSPADHSRTQKELNRLRNTATVLYIMCAFFNGRSHSARFDTRLPERVRAAAAVFTKTTAHFFIDAVTSIK